MKQEIRQQPPLDNGQHQTRRQSDARERHRTSHDEASHRCGRRSKGDAQSHFTGTLRHRIGHHSVDTEHGQQDSERGEQAGKSRSECRGRLSFRQQCLHRRQLQGNIGCQLARRTLQCRANAPGFGSRTHENVERRSVVLMLGVREEALRLGIARAPVLANVADDADHPHALG